MDYVDFLSTLLFFISNVDENNAFHAKSNKIFNPPK